MEKNIKLHCMDTIVYENVYDEKRACCCNND